ncbi:MAG: cytochrome c-type biogenesis protein CcmH [Candidatus Poribacteria bacterium]|nr:cytochrome c-type biogenesis protein CcmH [Candidatus Poribacteria bacterium]
MTRFPVVLIAFALIVGAAFAQSQHETFEYETTKVFNLTPEQESQLKKATRKILCNCGCPPTIVDDCMCGTARMLKDQMKASLLDGSTPEQLVASYVDRAGVQFLAAPPKEGFDLTIWIFPFIAFVGLTAVFGRKIVRLRGERGAAKPATQPSASLTEYQKQIEREVARRSSE